MGPATTTAGLGKTTSPTPPAERTAKRLKAVVLAAFAFGLVCPTITLSADRADQFQLRRSEVVEPAIPGQGFGGDPDGNRRAYRNDLFLNRNGGGGSLIVQTKGESRSTSSGRSGCNLSELLAFMVRVGFSACAYSSRQENLYYDTSLLPKSFVPSTQPPGISGEGGEVDELKTASDVASGVETFATRLREQTPLLGVAGSQYEATVQLMANPITPKRSRRLLIENLTAATGSSATAGVRDARGRWASLVQIADDSRAGPVTFQHGTSVRSYDLTNSAQLALRLFYDPRTFDILEAQTVLVSTTLTELQPFAQAGSPQPAIYTQVFQRERRVRELRFTQRRVPCQKLGYPPGSICIDVGRPGGKGISIG